MPGHGEGGIHVYSGNRGFMMLLNKIQKLGKRGGEKVDDFNSL